jgi:hypothetical protein
MLLVLRVSEGGKVFAVAPRATAIFRWARSFPLAALRVFRLRVRGRKSLEPNLMPPAVAESATFLTK